MWELLQDKTYIRYWLAVVVSFLGDAMTRITLIYLIANRTDSPAMIALVVVAQVLPMGALSVFLGPFTDRFPQRVLLIGSDLARMAVVLAMIFVLDSVWLLLLLTFLQGMGKALFETARIAAIPKFVGTHSIPAAIALFQTTSHVLFMLGPVVGGLLVARARVEVVFALDAATFVLSALLIGSLAVLRDPPRQPVEDTEDYWRAFRNGLRGMLAVPTLRFLYVFLGPVMVVLGLFTTNFNSQLLTVFDLTADHYGFAHALFGVGSIFGVLLGTQLARRVKSTYRLLLASVALFAVSLVALAAVELSAAEVRTVAIGAWSTLTGISVSISQVPIANTLLRDLPEEIRGRGVGLMNSVTGIFVVGGVVLGGWSGARFGVGQSIIVAGSALLLVVLVLGILRLRGDQITGT